MNMRSQALLFVSVLALMVASCNQNKLKNVEYLNKIDIDPKALYVGNMSDLFEIVDIVFLETSGPSVLSAYDITKMRYYNGVFYLFDEWRRRGLFAFDSEGQFIRQIGKRGRGPGEYLTPRDFNINHWHDRIEIYDVLNDKILFFSFDGEFIGEYKLVGMKARAYAVFDPENYVFFNDGHENYGDDYQEIPRNFFISPVSEFSVKSVSVPTIYNYDFMNSLNPFSNHNNRVLFLSGLRDTIYSVFTEGIKPEFILRFKGDSIPSKTMEDGTDREIDSFLENNYVPGYKMYLNESANHITFSYSYGRGLNIVFFNKETNELINIGHKSMPVNDINYINLFPPRCVMEDSLFVALIEPADVLKIYDILAMKKRDNPQDLNINAFLKLEEVIAKIEEESNPFIVVYKMK
jgi:hypothetical protein